MNKGYINVTKDKVLLYKDNSDEENSLFDFSTNFEYILKEENLLETIDKNLADLEEEKVSFWDDLPMQIQNITVYNDAIATAYPIYLMSLYSQDIKYAIPAGVTGVIAAIGSVIENINIDNKVKQELSIQSRNKYLNFHKEKELEVLKELKDTTIKCIIDKSASEYKELSNHEIDLFNERYKTFSELTLDYKKLKELLKQNNDNHLHYNGYTWEKEEIDILSDVLTVKKRIRSK